jgi:hypothetical protein
MFVIIQRENIRPSKKEMNKTITMKFSVFWDVAPCSEVDVDRRFRGAYCLHHQGDE